MFHAGLPASPAKLGVASRAELSAKMFHEQVAPELGSQQVRPFDRGENSLAEP